MTALQTPNGTDNRLKLKPWFLNPNVGTIKKTDKAAMFFTNTTIASSGGGLGDEGKRSSLTVGGRDSIGQMD